MHGRTTLQQTLDAIAAREYQRAGEIALSGVATPMRLVGEALAGLIEAFAESGAGGVEWRDRVVVALDDTVPKLLDGMQVLYANVLFERLLRPRDEPLFKLDVPDAEQVNARASADVATHGAEGANLEHARQAFAECTHLIETVLRVAETWASCANDPEKLKEFYALAEDGAKELMDRATTLRVAATVFRGSVSRARPGAGGHPASPRGRSDGSLSDPIRMSNHPARLWMVRHTNRIGEAVPGGGR
jgi:hypothetical protein